MTDLGIDFNTAARMVHDYGKERALAVAMYFEKSAKFAQERNFWRDVLKWMHPSELYDRRAQ
jgi:hypothetical protein